jgi:sRNA-binding protein
MKHVNLFEKFISEIAEEVLEAKEESKKEPKEEEPKEEEPKEEEIDSKLTPSSSIEFVKGYVKDQKMKMKDGEKSKFQELIEVLKDFVKERKELGRKH